MRSDAIKPGDVIAGKYRVRAILSRQRGFLVEAFHTEFDQRVAIRILSTNLVDEKEVERFRREARTLAKLESEHVARIVDVGSTQDGAFYFARQYLEGQDLAAHLKQRGALPFAEAVLFILQVCEAVAETHVHNIILRELQPSHLFLTQRLGGQQLKIIDFGTAKLMRDAAAPTAGGELTATSMFGLSCYSSPELVRKAKHVDVRTDVWSLGAILYQMLTARPPFAGEMAALMLAITRDDPVPVTRYRRDIPPEIDSIVNWALAKDPDGRFANVYGFAHALTPFASPEGQILIKRIGEITTAGKQRRKEVAQVRSTSEAAAVDRDHPITMDGTDLVEEDDPDDVRTAYRHPDAPVVGPQYRAPAALPASAPAPRQEETAPLDRTVFIGAGFTPGSPAAPSAAATQPVVGGRGSQPNLPAFAGAAAEGQRASHPAWQPMPVPPPSGPGGAPAGFGQPQPYGEARMNGVPQVTMGAEPPNPRAAAMATIQSSSPVPSGYASPGPAKPPPRAQKVALAVVAGSVVLLSVVAVLVVFKGHGSADATAEVASGAPAASATAVPTASVTAASTAPTPAAVTAAPTPTAEPVAAADPATPSAASVVAASGPKVAANTSPAGKAVTTGGTPAPPAGHAKDPPPVAAPPAAAGGGDNGTLVAVAVGGSCAFSVNGASKGTTSTLKVSLKPGTYSVTCAPSSGSSKSKSVTVTSGGTAMAMFKL
jgi:eukaryotic-like serine/threonine-protein kinase